MAVVDKSLFVSLEACFKTPFFKKKFPAYGGISCLHAKSATICEFWGVIFCSLCQLLLTIGPHFPFSLKNLAIYTRFVAKILVGPSLEKFLAAPMVITDASSGTISLGA